jgi:hypothetical protein
MIITKKLVTAQKRTSHTARLFGLHFPMHLEPVVYTITDRIAEDYLGGFWDFWELSNGGFYMSPRSDKRFNVGCDNGYGGEMSVDALGITVCLYAYSNLSFGTESQFTQTCAQQYHWLRDYALDHDDSRAIFRAVD